MATRGTTGAHARVLPPDAMTIASGVQLCIDAGPSENLHRSRGIGTVARELLRACTPSRLAEHGVTATYIARHRLPIDLPWRQRGLSAALAGANKGVPARIANWWQMVDASLFLPWEASRTNARIFLATDPHAVPIARGFRTVGVLYDVAPLVFPELYLTRRRAGAPAWQYRQRLRRLRRADWWIAISEATKRDAVSLAGFDETRITVAPLAVDATLFHPRPAPMAAAWVAERFGISRPYILFVGAHDPRKNLDAALAAHAALPGKDTPDLVIVGQAGRPGAHTDGVRWLGQVAITDLPWLYAGAVAFVFPTLYEGFGLPVLEAMRCGTPVVTSPLSSIPEVAGDAALYADPRDVQALRDTLERVTADANLRSTMSRLGLARADAFTWGKTADLILAACATLARDRPAPASGRHER